MWRCCILLLHEDELNTSLTAPDAAHQERNYSNDGVVQQQLAGWQEAGEVSRETYGEHSEYLSHLTRAPAQDTLSS